MAEIVVYPGTFDPITNGHFDLINRASAIFGKVIVAVAMDTHKKTEFSLEKRLWMAEKVVSNMPGTAVVSFGGLLTDFVKSKNVKIIIRGIRAVSDFDYEFQLAGMNRQLSDNIETLFLMPGEQVEFISSSLVREVAKLGGSISKFVDPIVESELLRHYRG